MCIVQYLTSETDLLSLGDMVLGQARVDIDELVKDLWAGKISGPDLNRELHKIFWKYTIRHHFSKSAKEGQ